MHFFFDSALVSAILGILSISTSAGRFSRRQWNISLSNTHKGLEGLRSKVSLLLNGQGVLPLIRASFTGPDTAELLEKDELMARIFWEQGRGQSCGKQTQAYSPRRTLHGVPCRTP